MSNDQSHLYPQDIKVVIEQRVREARSAAIEEAARLMNARATERHGYDKYGDATAIRELVAK